LAGVVRAAREARGWSLQELAEQAGTTKSHVWKVEAKGAGNPTLALVVGLARAFEVEPGQFVALICGEKGGGEPAAHASKRGLSDEIGQLAAEAMGVRCYSPRVGSIRADTLERVEMDGKVHGEMVQNSAMCAAEPERDFEIMLRRIVYRWDHRPGFPMDKLIAQAKDLLRRRGKRSPLRGSD
jgi:transcriptional regulator with XRE-family HTH domain